MKDDTLRRMKESKVRPRRTVVNFQTGAVFDSDHARAVTAHLLKAAQDTSRWEEPEPPQEWFDAIADPIDPRSWQPWYQRAWAWLWRWRG